MMGCFATAKSESKQRSSSAPRSSTVHARTTTSSTVVASKDSLTLLSNKPVVLPDPDHLLPRASRQSFASGTKLLTSVTRSHEEPMPLSDHIPSSKTRFVAKARTSFSAPLATHNEATLIGFSRLQELPNEVVVVASSDVEVGGKTSGLRTLRRAASFGGRPQPLPRLPVAELDDVLPKTNPLQVYNLPLPAFEDAVPTSSSRFAPRSRTRSFKLEAAGIINGRVTPEGSGLPLPPPSLATKLLPSLAAFEFRHLALATDDFAASCCVSKSASGDVFRARVEHNSSGAKLSPHAKLDVAVLRLPENTQQGATEWKSEVQLLAQISSPNVCAVKGYCAHDAGSRLSSRARRQERLLVFEQPSNGSLYEHLFGSQSVSNSLDWNTRVNIALGAARGLLYIHDRAPLQITFKEFTASSVLLENDYAAKLAGYGLSVTVPHVHRSSSFTTSLMLSQSQAKDNVRSFGILLLELLTGKNSRDAIYFGDDANFVQWGRQFMTEESRLAQVVDTRMRGVCPTKGAMEVVSLLLQCVSKREAQRPSMSEVVGTLKTIKARHCSKSEAPRWNYPKVVRQSQESYNFRDHMQTSSDDSSSENEDNTVAMSRRSGQISM